jgi:hypothetical protein
MAEALEGRLVLSAGTATPVHAAIVQRAKPPETVAAGSDAAGRIAHGRAHVAARPRLSAIAVSPPSSSLQVGSVEAFTATALDQFGHALARAPRLKWSATAGTITRAGTLTPPASGGPIEVTASRGAIRGQAVVTVLMPGATTITDAEGLPATCSVPVASRPIIVAPASASPGPVTDAELSVWAVEGTSTLSCTWTATAMPAGAEPPSISAQSADGTEAHAVFHEAGPYTFTATATDQAGMSVSSSVEIDVPQVPRIVITPGSVELRKGATESFSASLQDQFGQALASPPAVTWSATYGSISADGLYTAPNTYETDTVTAAAGSIRQSASVDVSPGPWVDTPAAASPGEVAGNATTLSVVADMDGQDPSLCYYWGVTVIPRGAPFPSFSAGNDSHAGNTTTVTFYQAGRYTFNVDVYGVRDGSVVYTTSSVGVTVDQTLTSISVTPGPLALGAGQSRALIATARDQFGQAMLDQPALSWSATAGTVTSSGVFTAPIDGTIARVSAAAGSVVGGATVYPASALPTVASAAAAAGPVTGTSTVLSVLGADPAGESNLTYTWSITAMPPGIAAPIFETNGSNAAKTTTVAFAGAGRYGFRITITGPEGLTATSTLGVVVDQTFTTIAVTPGAVEVERGQTLSLAASARDQFDAPMASQPVWSWSASAGSIAPDGLFTAPESDGVVTVKAAAGGLTAAATLTVVDLTFADPAIGRLVQSLSADGVLDRNDMIQILREPASEGTQVDQAEMDDLRALVANASLFRMPDDVQTLAGDVIDGSPANAHFQGQPLGNLAVGSPVAQLNDLVAKWFLGADHPSVDGRFAIDYISFAGSLFAPGGPSVKDMQQGAAGDCALIAGLGALANSDPSAVRNMFLDNGDGTWTVRFYADGVPDYVTVDRSLPVLAGTDTPFYAGVGGRSTDSQDVLWVALAEKAYAQWNETGREAWLEIPGDLEMKDGTNSYDSLDGSFAGTLFQQVLGDNSRVRCLVTDMTEQELIGLLAAHEAVACSTRVGAQDFGLIAAHGYTVVGYDPVSDTFQLGNPWGVNNNPPPLSFAVLRSYGGTFDIADAAGTSAIRPL